MGETVGAIYLNLEVVNTIGKQIRDIAKSEEGKAGKAFDGVAKSISESLKKPSEVLGKTVQNTLSETKSAVKETAKAIKTETGALFPDEIITKKSMLASQMVKDPYGSPRKPSKPVDMSDVFRLATDEAGLLQQKLDVINNQILEQEDKLRNVAQLWSDAASSQGEGSDEAVKYNAQMEAIKGKLITLQQSANQTQLKLSKALDASESAKKTERAVVQTAKKVVNDTTAAAGKSAASASKASERITSFAKKIKPAVAKTMDAVKAKIGGAFQGAGKAAAKGLDSIKRKAGGLARSVKSAFKSAVLMAGLYAAFRGVKSLIGDATMQNKEFAASLNLIKSNLLVAFTPIMQAIQPALNALASGLAAVSHQIASVTAGLFGQTYNQAKAATKQMQSVSAAAKKASTSLSIDELNVVSQPDSDASSANLGALDNAKYEDAANFGSRVKGMLMSLAQSIGPTISKILVKLAQSAPSFFMVGGEILNQLLMGFNANAEGITSSAVIIINSMMSGLQSSIPQIGEFAVNMVMFLATCLITAAPQLLSAGIMLLQNILYGLSQKIPELIPKIEEAVFIMLSTLEANLPGIINSGVSIITSLITGIAAMLPELIPSAVSCVLTLVQGLTDNLPMMWDAAIQLIVGLAQGLVNSLPVILEKGPKIIQSLVDGLVGAVPKLIDGAIAIIMGLVDFLINDFDKIVSAGYKIVTSIVSGLIKAIPELWKAIPKLVKAIIDKFKETDWLQVGKDLIAGIGKGLVEGVKNIGGSIKEAAGGLVDSVKGFFGIHSPSRLFRDEVGENLALGIGEGFTDGMDDVSKSMRRAIPVPKLSGMTISSADTAASRSDNSIYGLLVRILAAVQLCGRGEDTAVVNLLERLLRAVEAIDPTFEFNLDDRGIARLANSGNKRLGYKVADVYG